jgi:solute:Na+ symporter, SSS family
MGKLTVQTLARSGMLADDGVLRAIGDFNAYYFAGVLFIFSVMLVSGVSAMTTARSEESIQGITYASTTAAQQAEFRASYGALDIFATALVLALVLTFYLYFSFWLE